MAQSFAESSVSVVVASVELFEYLRTKIVRRPPVPVNDEATMVRTLDLFMLRRSCSDSLCFH